MYFEKTTHPRHEGVETYREFFLLKEQDDLYDVKGFGVQFTIRPEDMTLVWERYLDGGVPGPWRRVDYRPRGAFSAIRGPRVLKNGGTTEKQDAFVLVFADTALGGPLSRHASSMPGLEDLVKRLEAGLPAKKEA